MPIGNQEIWDKGIGAGATNVIFGQSQPAATNFNPGALGADPNAQPAATPAVETPAAQDQSALRWEHGTQGQTRFNSNEGYAATLDPNDPDYVRKLGKYNLEDKIRQMQQKLQQAQSGSLAGGETLIQTLQNDIAEAQRQIGNFS